MDIVDRMDRNPKCGHVTVTWKDHTIVWGGTRFDPSFVYYHLCGEWIWHKTSGDVPEKCSFATAVVIKDKMIVVGARESDTNNVHVLDLKSWNWTRITPKGIPPLKGTYASSSWAYQGKMYCFGGHRTAQEVDPSVYPSYMKTAEDRTMQMSNQFICYNPSTNSWEWPNIKGDIPEPRSEHKTAINGSTVML